MANFRNGNLVQGQTLGASYLTVDLTENHQVVNVGANQVVFLRSDSDIASDRDFEIVSSTIQGQQVVFVFESDSPKACQLLYTPGVGNVRITSLWAPAKFDAITLSWDGQFWVEVSRSNVSSGGGFDPTITSPVTGDVLVYNGGLWQNKSFYGAITNDNSGLTTISPSYIVNSQISPNAAISYIKLAPLPSGQIIVGSSLNNATPVAMSGVVLISNAGVTSFNPNVVYQTYVERGSISSAQILALPSPVVLLTPPVGYVIQLQSVTFFIIGSTNYVGGSSLSFSINGSYLMSMGSDVFTSLPSGTKITAQCTAYNVPATGATSGQFGLNITNSVSNALEMTCSGAPFTLGNQAVSYYINYNLQQIF